MNRERQNDLMKRALHRMLARILAGDQAPLIEARRVVENWKREPAHAAFVDEWDEILSRPVDEVRRTITSRSSKVTRLRIDSPFYRTATRFVSDDMRARALDEAERRAARALSPLRLRRHGRGRARARA